MLHLSAKNLALGLLKALGVFLISPLTRKGRIFDFTSGPMAGGAAIPQDELEGYPECQHDVGVWDACPHCPQTQERTVHHYRNYSDDRHPRTTEPFGQGEPVASWEERKRNVS